MVRTRFGGQQNELTNGTRARDQRKVTGIGSVTRSGLD